jgi:hypothetical protein
LLLILQKLSVVTLRNFFSACAADTRSDAQKWLGDPRPHRSELRAAKFVPDVGLRRAPVNVRGALARAIIQPPPPFPRLAPGKGALSPPVGQRSALYHGLEIG